MSNMTIASRQWSQRPIDERYDSLQALHAATLKHRQDAATATVNLADIRTEARDGSVFLGGKTGASAEVTNWAFGQLSARAKAPASYLRTLPATLTVQNINHGLKARSIEDPNAEAKMLLHKNGGFYARAITSDIYTRIWNYTIVERLLKMEKEGWIVPPAYAIDGTRTRKATKEEAAVSLTIKEGDVIGPAGLYASFEDMFAFMVHPDKVIRDGTPDGLQRGFLVWNSEVGKLKFNWMGFYHRGVCGNHIIWGASEVKQISLRHV